MVVAVGEGMVEFVQARDLWRPPPSTLWSPPMTAWFPDGHPYQVKRLSGRPEGIVVEGWSAEGHEYNPLRAPRGFGGRRLHRALMTVGPDEWIPVLVPW